MADGIPDLLADADASARDLEVDFTTTRRRSLTPKEWQTEAYFRWMRQTIQAEVDRLGRGLDFVDIGCGDLLLGTGGKGGRYFDILKTTARSYIGIEPSWPMIKNLLVPDANLEYLQNSMVVRSVGEDMPVQPGTADIVVSLSSLDHCTDARRTLVLAREALRPDGLLLMTLQNRGSWYRSLVKSVAPDFMARRDAADHHHHFFTYSSAAALLADTGFQRVEVVEQGFVAVPGVANVVHQLLRPVAGRVTKERGADVMWSVDGALARVAPGLGSVMLITARS